MNSDDPGFRVPDYGLKCKGCGYLLAGLSRMICPECGRAFKMEEFIPDGDFPPVFLDGRPVLVELEVRDLMNRYHIPFIQQSTLSESIMIAVGSMAHAPSRLCVPRGHYFDVLDLLRRDRLKLELPPPPGSGDSAVEWNCPACSESNPGTFELCWNCERERT